MASAFTAAALLLLFRMQLLAPPSAAQPGFISLDCGGARDHTDTIGIQWTSDASFVSGGQEAQLLVQNGLQSQQQFTTVRYFPADNSKYCYTMNVRNRTRYLVRATFLYGNFDNSNVYPKFDISLGASPWSTIVIDDATTPIVEEAIILAAAPTLSVCLSNASTGQPFISTLELRQFNGSLYYTTDETRFFLALSARINFGAESNDSIRYPDDPFDRIWESDSVRRANYLVDVAPGTERISTTKPIFVSTNEEPPEKVMQTAVVGQDGSLNYRLDLEGFPANAWGVSYFAEIEDLAPNETRKFKLDVPGMPALSKPTVDVEENAQGKYRLYEPGYTNLSLPFVFSFGFKKTNDSTKGPILNALELYKYVQITMGSQDANIMASMVSRYSQAGWAQEGGDPCLPASWSWVQCSSEDAPRVFSITLSGKNITGSIPVELTKLSGLVELRLEGNSFSGQIPDFSECHNLQYIHLENNQLTGELPPSLGDLPNLKELYVQNNKLSGQVPKSLFKRSIILNFSGNSGLHIVNSGISHTIIIICVVIGAIVLLGAAIGCYFFTSRRKKKPHEDTVVIAAPAKKLGSYFSEVATESAHRFSLSEIEDATDKFERRIGSGGFGIVYYGKLADGREIAVKLLTNDSYQGIREFLNEVTLLSRIHHRHLVTFLGYSQQDGKNILVYEFMHNGTLKEHLRGAAEAKVTSWLKRLVDDFANGTVLPELVVADPLTRGYTLLPRIPESLVASLLGPVGHKYVENFDAFFVPSGDYEEENFRLIGWTLDPATAVVFVYSSLSGTWTAGTRAVWDELGLNYSSLSGTWTAGTRAVWDELGLNVNVYIEEDIPPEWWRSYAYGCFYWKVHNSNKLLKLDVNRMDFSAVGLPLNHEKRDAVVAEAGEGRFGIVSLDFGQEIPHSMRYSIRQNEGEIANEHPMETAILLPGDYDRFSPRRILSIFLALEIETLKIERVCSTRGGACDHVLPYFGFPPFLSLRRI